MNLFHKSLDYFPVFANFNFLHDLSVLMVAVEFDYLSVHPIFTEIISNTKVNIFGSPSRYHAGKHTIIKSLYFWLFKSSINKYILRRSISSNPNIIQRETLSKYLRFSFDSIALEYYVVVSFSGLDDLME